MTVAKSHPQTAPLALAPWEVFARARVEGKTQHEAWCLAFPTTSHHPATVRGRASQLDRSEQVRGRIAELKALAMQDARQSGADLVATLGREIEAAGSVEAAAAIHGRIARLEAEADAAGDLQIAVSLVAARIKLLEVLGRIRMSALGQLTKYASGARVTAGEGRDGPVSVQINLGLPDGLPGGSPQQAASGTPRILDSYPIAVGSASESAKNGASVP